jgi:hypothetical protein
MRMARWLGLVNLSLLVSACSIDRRDLSASTAGGGAEPNPGSSAQAGAEDSTPGGVSGRLVNGCADLDTDGVADCKTTLVANPTFKETVEDWRALTETQLSWETKNALEDLPSGSAYLKGSNERAQAAQCVRLEGKRLVIAYASAFVATEAERGQAVLELSFFDSSDCSGESVSYFDTPPSNVTNAWTTIQAGWVSPPTTASVSVALVGLKPDGAEEIQVYFDNVMLKAQEAM